MGKILRWSRGRRAAATTSAPETSSRPQVHDDANINRRYSEVTSEEVLPDHGLGLEVWAGSEIEDPEAIIVFVHGLGDGRSTWTSKRNDILWPRYLLPRDLPKAVIMNFRYHSRYRDWLEATSIHVNARNLLHGLVYELRNYSKGENYAPLIFVGHSMGGVLCEKALVMAHHSETEKVRKVCLSTIGLMLMGTPHMGSDLAAWSNLMDKLSRLFNTPMSNSFLRSNVSSSDENMAQLQIEFFQIVRERHSGQKIEIISFYEQLSTKGIGLIVGAHSGILPGYESVGLHASHVDMTRFEGFDDICYELFVSRLRRIVFERSHKIVGTSAHDREVSEPTTLVNSTPYMLNEPSNEATPSSTNSPEQILVNSVSELLDRGQFRQAEAVQRQLLESTRLSYGPMDQRTLVLKKNLGTIYYMLGDWQESENLLRETVEEHQKLFGNQHERTLDAMSSLAVTLLCQCEIMEAEELQERVVEAKSASLGRKNIDTLREQAILARIFAKNGQIRKAVDLRVEVLSGRTALLGQDHPETLLATGDILLSYIDDERLQGLENRGRELVERCEDLLGQEHPVTLKVLNILARILMQQGKPQEAYSIQEGVVDLMGARIGQGHPDTLRAKQILAIILSRLGRENEAVDMQQRVCRAFRRALRVGHPWIDEAGDILEELERGGVVRYGY